ncbi:MAG: FecR family protein [bacterium]
MKTSWKKFTVMTALMIFFIINAAAAEQISVTVQKAEGTVEARTAAGAAWTAAAQGSKLSAGASIRTGQGSSCILKWGDGHVTKLQSLTSMEISRLEKDSAGNENTNFNITVGKINTHVGKLTTRGSSFTVKTPTAVAGVRGTDLFVNVGEDKTSTFGVTEGEIFVEVGGVESVIAQYFIVTVNPDGTAGAPEPMPEAMKQEAREQISEAKQEAQAEKEPTGKEEEKKTEEKPDDKKDETVKTDEKVDELTAAEESAAVETAAPAEDIAGIAADITDIVLDQQLTNDIINAAEEAYKTGQFEMEIYVEP